MLLKNTSPQFILISFLITLTACEEKTNANATVINEEEYTFHNRLNHSEEFNLNDLKSDYAYHVSGSDEKGKETQGRINLEGEFGEGMLIGNADIPKIDIVIETGQKGELLAIDAYGNKYFLKVIKPN